MKSKKHIYDLWHAGIERFILHLSDLPVVGVLTRAALKSQKDMAKDMAASIAYFTFLSLFPTILGLFAISGFLLKSDDAQTRLRGVVADLFPASADFVMRNVESLIALRGTVGVISILVLLWTGKKMVAAIRRGINLALGFERPYDQYLSPLRDFGQTLAISLILFVAIGIAPIINVLGELELGLFGDRWNAFFGMVSGLIAGFAVSALLLGAIYWLTPFHRLTLKELAPGILFAAVTVELGKKIFSEFVGNVSPYDAVYGSVSSIIALLIWLYIAARLVLYGSEIVAVLRDSPYRQVDPPPASRDADSQE